MFQTAFCVPLTHVEQIKGTQTCLRLVLTLTAAPVVWTGALVLVQSLHTGAAVLTRVTGAHTHICVKDNSLIVLSEELRSMMFTTNSFDGKSSQIKAGLMLLILKLDIKTYLACRKWIISHLYFHMNPGLLYTGVLFYINNYMELKLK